MGQGMERGIPLECVSHNIYVDKIRQKLKILFDHLYTYIYVSREMAFHFFFHVLINIIFSTKLEKKINNHHLTHSCVCLPEDGEGYNT